MLLIVESCNKLKGLKAAHCALAVTDNVIKKLATLCKDLKAMDISYCKSVTDDALEAFSKSKTCFSSILVNALENITPMGVISLIRNSHQFLEQLEISLLDATKFDESICSYICKCEKLKILDITGLNTIQDEGLNTLYQSTRQNLS